MSDKGVALVTDATRYAGPPSAAALLEAGFQVACHDPGFSDPGRMARFAEENPGLEPFAEQGPEELVEAVGVLHGGVDVLVSNEGYPAVEAAVEDADLSDLRATLEAVLVRPFAMARAVVPQMKRRREGRIVLVTSARPLRPYAGFSIPTAARGGANALAVALAKELASHNVQVNAVAPNYLYSEAYFPAAKFIDDPEGRRLIEELVPMGRLGRPEEVGALIAFLASGEADFLTGQVIPFTGGWP